jgi:hypothetical protein
VLTLLASLGTGCCHNRCYDQCGGNYDPCTGLVHNQCEPASGCRAKRLLKKLQKDDCNCGKQQCGCQRNSHQHGGCSCNHGTSQTSTGCQSCQSNGETIYGQPTYGEPVYGEAVDTYSYPELMVPQETQPIKPVPAPPAELNELPMDSSIPPASYVVPAPLEGPSVPVLQPYHGR